MPLERLAHCAFAITCDRCKLAAPMVILGDAAEHELRYHGPIEAIECATRRGFDLSFRMDQRRVLVTRALCRTCARLFVN